MPATAPPLPAGMPLPAGSVVGAATVFQEPRLQQGRCLWLEQRPSEGGRTTLRLRDRDGQERDLTPGFDLRSRIHGYGGGVYSLAGSQVVFISDGGRSLWLLDLERAAEPAPARRISPDPDPARPALFGDGLIDLRRQRWIGVCEQDGRDRLVSLPLQGGALATLHESDDFCGYAVLSPAGSHLAWVGWSQPCMPWDRSRLWLARLASDGHLRDCRVLAGSTPGEGPASSVFQPLWVGSTLVVAWDRSGWWNLEALEGATDLPPADRPRWRSLLPMQAEFGMPQWVYGMRTTAWDGQQLIAAACQEGRWKLGALLPESGGPVLATAPTPAAAPDPAATPALPPEPTSSPPPPGEPGAAATAPSASGLAGRLRWQPIPLPFDDLAALDAQNGRLVAIASGPDRGAGLLELDCASGGWQHRSAQPPLLATAAISRPEPHWFAGHNGQRTHAWFYPPSGGAGPHAPLLIRAHSGPTGMARTGLSLAIQFWTSRGWGVVDVNYGGSTGFGRAYRERLDRQWGVVDVDDCLAAARTLVAAGRADPRRIAMEGGSAAGFTVLAALAREHTIRAGAVRYPVTDLGALAEGDHRFEARYFDALVGPWPAARALYAQRSPLAQADRIQAPLLFFHGLDDTVVPPAQSQALVERLRSRGVPVELQLFPGEGHGFRAGAVQQQVLERTEAFFRHHFQLPEPTPGPHGGWSPR